MSILKSDDISPFRKDVYRVVSEIPRGQTRSYSWVAGRIGRPGASRAVGNALNSNPYPVSIPCHRVIKSDGSIGGYMDGSARKRGMLKAEGIDWRHRG